MDEKNILPRDNKTTADVILKLIEGYNYRKGVEDAIRGTRLGVGICLTGLLGAVIVSGLIERYRNRKEATPDTE